MKKNAALERRLSFICHFKTNWLATKTTSLILFLFLFSSPHLFAQTKMVTGIVSATSNNVSKTNVPETDLPAQGFMSPPDSCRPGVYWYFMDGNLSKEGMTKDLESMKKAGIGNLIFLEVNVGIPRGPVDFLSNQWQELFKHAVNECERLGISMTLGIGPGWTGSGGPWIRRAVKYKRIKSVLGSRAVFETYLSGG